MASRGLDQVAGTNMSGAYPENETALDDRARGLGSSAPDGTPGNPPGTMASRGLDEVAGTNVSGAHPENEDADRDLDTDKTGIKARRPTP